MQQEIKLTNESSNTVFVDDVDVSNGVYAKRVDTQEIAYLYHRGIYVLMLETNREIIEKYSSLFKAIEICGLWEFYTIPDNKRIVTERELTIDDLKNTDHVGFVDEQGNKGFVVCSSSENYTAITSDSYGKSCNGHFAGGTKHETLVCALLEVDEPKKIIRFTERTGEGGLYEWLNKK